jgi:hypothetical protein
MALLMAGEPLAMAQTVNCRRAIDATQRARHSENERLGKVVEKNLFETLPTTILAFPQLPCPQQLATQKTTRGVAEFYYLKVLLRDAYIDVQLNALNG